ncbi:GTP cyclohydrolase II [Croceicoccus sp. F390]|uniref:GTP cyclohydrolase-2 n=1 Tax=Croceicoccus esteveae TaxID=3075597 RepID=A0ABU2ZN43_9SPHN|nr:GTP cyclohydrolase II [Croceicoccus sp. F390]MDT0576857.1 GTP cyclohydrolase II [Croceicoccus sp. F390]
MNAPDLSDKPSSRKVAQAIDALRHGWPVCVGAMVLLPAETAYDSGNPRSDRLLISAARAATLHLANQKDAAIPEAPVLIRAAQAFTLADARMLGDPTHDLANPLAGPFRAEPLDTPDDAVAAMTLARLAGILPAFMVDASPSEECVPVSLQDLAVFRSSDRLTIQTRAALPVRMARDAQIIAYRAPDDLREHIALVIGRAGSDRVPLVRLHSECLTGDVLGSLKCDCGPQLDTSLSAMAREADQGGWGILLYLRQEGRGIGLVNKLRAYRLQDQGFDTVDANNRLGLPTEARDFPVAARMLHLLNVAKVRLMTNNPAKVAALEEVGIDVVERVPHQLAANEHNARYLDTKRDRTGHLLL